MLRTADRCKQSKESDFASRIRLQNLVDADALRDIMQDYFTADTDFNATNESESSVKDLSTSVEIETT